MVAAVRKLGRYTVLHPLAQGGMADLLLARTDGLAGFERHVVIKRIRPEQASNRPFVEMFLTEARLAASLHHANIIQVQDIGEDGGLPYFAMEYIHGEDVRRLLRHHWEAKQQVPVQHVLTIAIGVAAALHHAHEQVGPDRKPLGLVHRDVTPGNIIVGYDGHVKLVDFGIAKALLPNAVATEVGVLKGKAPYMSPEQCAGTPVDRRSDLFSLGIVLYELATVRRLFKGATEYVTMSAIVQGKVPPPRQHRPDLPPRLEHIILKLLTRDRARRYQTAEQVRLELDELAKEHGGASVTALHDYMKQQFGSPPEPWLLDTVAEAPLVDFDGNAAGLAAAPAAAVALEDFSQPVAADAPIARARTKAITENPPPPRALPLPAPPPSETKEFPPEGNSATIREDLGPSDSTEIEIAAVDHAVGDQTEMVAPLPKPVAPVGAPPIDDAPRVDLAPAARKPRTLIYAGLAGAAVVIAIVVFALSGGETRSAEPPVVSPSLSPPPPASEHVAPIQAPAVAPPPPDAPAVDAPADTPAAEPPVVAEPDPAPPDLEVAPAAQPKKKPVTKRPPPPTKKPPHWDPDTLFLKKPPK